MPLPISIDPCPIVDAFVEAQFFATRPDEAVFGVLYDRFAREFPKVENLPVSQVPPAMRNLNPQLRFLPTHRLQGTNYYTTIGPKVITTGIQMPYPGWTAFRAKLIDVFSIVLDTGIIKQLRRLGCRYINLFEGDVTQRLTLQARLGNQPLVGKKTLFRTILQRNDSDVTLRVAKDHTIKRGPHFKRQGTLIDIAVIRSTDRVELANITEFIDSAHSVEKNLFFELLPQDFVDELHPKY